MSPNMIKTKKCKFCKQPFIPFRPLQMVCSPECSYQLVIKMRITQEAIQKRAGRAETKKMKDAIKPKSKWLQEAQAWFNKFIRLRDANEPCISCGRHHAGQYHAGHYRSVGSSPELRFNELNNHKQCAPCNNHLSGNIVNYRHGLIKKIGLEMVEWLEGPHEPLKLTVDDIKAIKAKYTLKCSEILKGQKNE